MESSTNQKEMAAAYAFNILTELYLCRSDDTEDWIKTFHPWYKLLEILDPYKACIFADVFINAYRLSDEDEAALELYLKRIEDEKIIPFPTINRRKL